MSVNQSRGDKNEEQQYRRLGRSGNSSSQRNSSGGDGSGGGGGDIFTAPPFSSSFSSQRSFKLTNNHSNSDMPNLQPSARGPEDVTDLSTPTNGPADVSNAFQVQFGSISSPNTPMQVMHKAERIREVFEATDEEEAKQRQIKGILNKLTPQNFEKLFKQVKQVNIDNANTLSGLIIQIYDRALMEPTFSELFANFCSRLAFEIPYFSEDGEKITFKRLLVNKCQKEFERGKHEEQEANRTEEEGEVKLTEEKRVEARRRVLGNIRLIGELYKKKMLTERIMHECIKKLLGQYQNPDEEDLESLCQLLSTIGAMIDHPRAKEHVDVYFDTMSRLSNNMKISSSVRFMLKDVIDLRNNKWQQRRKIERPKFF